MTFELVNEGYVLGTPYYFVWWKGFYSIEYASQSLMTLCFVLIEAMSFNFYFVYNEGLYTYTIITVTEKPFSRPGAANFCFWYNSEPKAWCCQI